MHIKMKINPVPVPLTLKWQLSMIMLHCIRTSLSGSSLPCAFLHFIYFALIGQLLTTCNCLFLISLSKYFSFLHLIQWFLRAYRLVMLLTENFCLASCNESIYMFCYFHLLVGNLCQSSRFPPVQ